jgi:hypothetical protein
MGKFDREIKDAEKIANGWVNDSDAVEGQFIDIKKNNVKWDMKFADATYKSLIKQMKNKYVDVV